MRSKRKPVSRTARLVLAAIVAFGVLSLVASSRSLTPRPSGEVAQTRPFFYGESEAPNRATPNDLRDLQLASGGEVTADQVRRMQAQADAVPAAAGGIKWEQLGPFNIGARITDTVADPTRPNAAWTAVAGGGVWYTSDGGANWTNVWPDENTQPMGALARGKDGTLWAGTGEANPPGGGLTYFGDGIYKSTDNGAHWTNVGLRKSEAIGRIAVDPVNPQRVFAAASGHVARSAPERGLYRTSDGGQTWQLVLAPPNASTGAIDVAINPANSNIVFASLWDHRRTNGTRIYGGVGSGLFRSMDGGDTWQRLENITGGISQEDTTGTGLTSSASLGRIGVALAPSSPNIVYIVFGNQTGPYKGFYVSSNNGDSFSCPRGTTGNPPPCGTPGPGGGFQWWFGRLWVDPQNPNNLWAADVNLRRSTNGGATWTNAPGVHADQHSMAWDETTLDNDPTMQSHVFLGNDGGMYLSVNNGANFAAATNQPWNQIYSLAVSRQDPRRMAIGLQDNGSQRSWVREGERPPIDEQLRNWESHGGGDGHYNVIDPVDDAYYYACSQGQGSGNHACRRYHDPDSRPDGIGIAGIALPQGSSPNRVTTHTPLVVDPNASNVIYIGAATIGRSLDRGATALQPISPVKPASVPNEQDPRLPGPVPPEEMDQGLYANLYGAVTALAPAKSATPVPYAQTIYAGTDTGKVWKTTDAGQNWTQMTGLPARWVNYIIADPDDSNHTYVAFSGFRQGDDAANIWETRDGGANWSNISFNLPNGPVEMIEYNPKADVLFAATDVGVFDHKDGDPYWYKVSVGMPQVPVLDIKLTADGKYLIAATFGRSVWKLPLSTDATDGGGASGSVPATLSLSLGPNASFGAFTPGVMRTYTASTSANVISTAGDALLSVADPSSFGTGHLVNGTFVLPQPLQARARNAGNPSPPTPAYNNVGSSASPLNLLTWSAPISNDAVSLEFSQLVNANDPLRTGSYSKTLTFTLSTANP